MSLTKLQLISLWSSQLLRVSALSLGLRMLLSFFLHDTLRNDGSEGKWRDKKKSFNSCFFSYQFHFLLKSTFSCYRHLWASSSIPLRVICSALNLSSVYCSPLEERRLFFYDLMDFCSLFFKFFITIRRKKFCFNSEGFKTVRHIEKKIVMMMMLNEREKFKANILFSSDFFTFFMENFRMTLEKFRKFQWIFTFHVEEGTVFAFFQIKMNFSHTQYGMKYVFLPEISENISSRWIMCFLNTSKALENEWNYASYIIFFLLSNEIIALNRTERWKRSIITLNLKWTPRHRTSDVVELFFLPWKSSFVCVFVL